MKKILLLLFVLSFLSENLYSQREVVIESFDDWGANGLPVGYEWNIDSMKTPFLSCINQVDGISGSAIKLIDSYSATSNPTNSFSRTINFVDEVPESISVVLKNFGSENRNGFMSVSAYNDSQHVIFFVPPGNSDYPEWYTYTKYLNDGSPIEFNKVIIRIVPFAHPTHNNAWQIYDEIKFIWGSSVKLIEPTKDDKWICGEKETIKWTTRDTTDNVRIEYSEDGGISYNLIDDNINASDNQYEWTIPDIEPTTKARIKIISHNTNDQFESKNFEIKPYIITRIDNNGDYISYDINIDRWNYGNYPNDMFPYSWWFNKFDYKNGIDPFTNDTYPQTYLLNPFRNAFRSDFPDWISFVNAFSVGTCYISTSLGIYSPMALLKWSAIKKPWGGSCFGIANANALAFSKRTEFQARYPNYPNFMDPINVRSDSNVIKVITELFTKQFGRLTSLHHDLYYNTTVDNTLDELKFNAKGRQYSNKNTIH